MGNIKAIFLDRDGTIIEDKHYLSDPNEVQLLPLVGETLKQLHDKGLQFFIVTNQSGIGRAYFPERDFHACQKELYRQLECFGVTIIDTAFCPHDPSNLHYSEFECVEMCECRKPNIGMWHQLEEKYHLKASECIMIGDKKEDLGFGINAGFAATCLVPTGKGLVSAKELAIEWQMSAEGQSLLEGQIIEFSSENVHTALPCNMQVSLADAKNKIQTKCFAISSFADLTTLINTLM